MSGRGVFILWLYPDRTRCRPAEDRKGWSGHLVGTGTDGRQALDVILMLVELMSRRTLLARYRRWRRSHSENAD